MCHRYMCIVLYIERDAITCAKFGVAVFKASMVNCKWSQFALDICALYYI